MRIYNGSYWKHISAYVLKIPIFLLLLKYYKIVTIVLSADTNTNQNKIRRTKLCVSNSIAVPSYLMLFAECLTSVVNLLPQSSGWGIFLYISLSSKFHVFTSGDTSSTYFCRLFPRLLTLQRVRNLLFSLLYNSFAAVADSATPYGISYSHTFIMSTTCYFCAS